LMDFDSRNYYRNRVEKLALKYKVSESHVAKKAVELARNAVENGNLTDKRLAHVGYYLVGKGICELEKEIGYEKSFNQRMFERIKEHPACLYFGFIGL